MNNTLTPMTDAEHAQFPMGGFTLDFVRQLERELTAAREEIDEIHATGGCSFIELQRVTEQRDRLAEALRMITTFDYTDLQCDNGHGARYVATEALQSLNQNHFPNVGNMIGTTTTEP